MVDIESNRFRIRSNGGVGGYTLTNLDTRESKQVSRIPDVKTLAAITEKQFDDEMLKLWNKGVNVTITTKLGYRLLANGDSNTKLRKNIAVRTFGLSMAPHKSAGVGNVCAFASNGCIRSCLGHQGLASVFASIQRAREKRTKLWYEDRELFLSTLRLELSRLSGFCAIRLNVFSDIPWEMFGIIDEFPNLQFYDYTKNPRRVGAIRPNYWTTFSRSETNESECIDILKACGNVAIVFADRRNDYCGNRSSLQQLPKEWNGFKVIDGDTTDLRFDDVRGRKFGRVVGLRLKAHSRDERESAIASGFAVDWR